MVGLQITLSDFILAAQRLRSDDPLVYKDGALVKGTSEGSLNQSTWQLFSRVVKEAIPKRKRHHICARYGFPWKKMVHSDLPLTPRDIMRFALGCVCAYTYNLQESLERQGKETLPLSQLSVEEIHQLFGDATRYGQIKRKDPRRVTGAPQKLHENFVLDYFKMDQQRCLLLRDVENLVSSDTRIPRMHPYYSRLTMGIISLLQTEKENKDINIIISAPGREKGQIDYYRVYDIISYGGLSAIALVPVSESSSLEPLLIFRCTQQAMCKPDWIASNQNNIEENNGELGYGASEEELSRLMEDPKFTQGKKIKVLAYSLGGSHATYFMQRFWNRVSEFVGFNFTGTKASVVEDIADQINALDETQIPPSFYLYRNQGDLVNNVGKKHIGWGIRHPNCSVQLIEWFIDNDSERIRLLPFHAVRPMDSEEDYDFKIYRGPTLCDPILNTYYRDSSLEDFRQKMGSKVLSYVIGLFNLINFFFRIFGIEFFKRNTRKTDKSEGLRLKKPEEKK